MFWILIFLLLSYFFFCFTYSSFRVFGGEKKFYCTTFWFLQFAFSFYVLQDVFARVDLIWDSRNTNQGRERLLSRDSSKIFVSSPGVIINFQRAQLWAALRDRKCFRQFKGIKTSKRAQEHVDFRPSDSNFNYFRAFLPAFFSWRVKCLPASPTLVSFNYKMVNIFLAGFRRKARLKSFLCRQRRVRRHVLRRNWKIDKVSGRGGIGTRKEIRDGRNNSNKLHFARCFGTMCKQKTSWNISAYIRQLLSK